MKRSSTKREEIYANHELTNDWYIECGRKLSTSAEKKNIEQSNYRIDKRYEQAFH